MSAAPGLCAACTNARTVESRRGSRFWLCALHSTDPRFPKYPGLPVLSCAGFRPRTLDTTHPVTDPVAESDTSNGGSR
jgi:hypothetical protein